MWRRGIYFGSEGPREAPLHQPGRPTWDHWVFLGHWLGVSNRMGVSLKRTPLRSNYREHFQMENQIFSEACLFGRYRKQRRYFFLIITPFKGLRVAQLETYNVTTQFRLVLGWDCPMLYQLYSSTTSNNDVKYFSPRKENSGGTANPYGAHCILFNVSPEWCVLEPQPGFSGLGIANDVFF